MLDCALISSDEGFRHAVLAVVRDAGSQVRLAVDLQVSAEKLGREGLAKVTAAGPRLAFLDLGEEPSGVGAIRMLNQDAPEMVLVVGGPQLTAEGLLAVMRAGASEYLPRPFSVDEVREAFGRVRRRTVGISSGEATVPGSVTTVFSAKGGTGVTTVATGLAVSIRELTDKEVILLDLTPSLGTAAVAMGLHPRYTYLDVVRNFHRVDEDLFRSFLEVHESGVNLLASPMTSADSGAISGDELHDLIAISKRHFDYVVIDGGNSLTDPLPVLLTESDERLLVVTPELPSLRNLKHALDLFGRENGKGPARVVLNMYKEGLGLSSGEVKDGLGYQLVAILEKDDERVLKSVNLGRPELLTGHSRFSGSLMGLGKEIAGSDNVNVKPRRFLGGWFRSEKKAKASRVEKS